MNSDSDSVSEPNESPESANAAPEPFVPPAAPIANDSDVDEKNEVEGDVATYDFRQPSSLDRRLNLQFSQLLEGMSPLIDERLVQYMPDPIHWEPGKIRLDRAGKTIEQIPEETFAFFFELGESKAPSAIIISRRLVLGLVGGMLGETYDELPENRELTKVEVSLAEMLWQDFIAVAAEAHTGEEPLTLRLDHIEAKPHRSRIFAPADNLAIAQFAITGPFGEHTIDWLIPLEALEATFPVGQSRGQSDEEKRRLTALVKQIPVRLEAQLGASQMHISELTNLRAGDVIMLEQRVMDSLSVCIQQQPKFRGWAGRVGKHQAVYVETEKPREA